jgi:hypothetical protein
MTAAGDVPVPALPSAPPGVPPDDAGPAPSASERRFALIIGQLSNPATTGAQSEFRQYATLAQLMILAAEMARSI